MADLIFPNGTKLSSLAPKNTANLLAGLTPAFSGFSTNPGTNADLVDEWNNVLTTNGVIPNDTYCIVTYDLGAVKRFVGTGISQCSSGVVYQAIIMLSINGTDYRSIAYCNDAAINTLSFMGNARYIQAWWSQKSGSAQNLTHASLRVYNI